MERFVGSFVRRMKRALNWLALGSFSAVALLTVMLILAGVSLRAKRHESSAPERVTTRVLSIRNFLSDIYAARVGAHIIVFDAGMDPEAHALELLVDSLGADLASVSDIFLTHAHFDHVAAAARCPRARIHIGAADADMLAHRASALAIVPRLFGTLLSVPPVEASHRLVGSETIDVGEGESVLALPLPGHTAGSYAYLFDGVLFTGDAFFVNDGRLTLAAADTEELGGASCRGLSQIHALIARQRVSEICTGHRGCTPQQDASRVLETLTIAAGPRCSG
jgi:glyoxylase-like metal-dependent hydrolase (beta-lactamase superfamily II)